MLPSLNPQGTYSSYTATTGTVTVNTHFHYNYYMTYYLSEYAGSFPAITSVGLPDGSQYAFSYDSGSSAYHYGLVNQMTLPTGGTINYSYQVFTDAYGIPYTMAHTRTTPDSSTPWTYGHSLVTTCTSTQIDCGEKFTVSKPSGDNIVYTFNLNGGAWGNEVQYYSGSISSPNLLATVSQCYNYVTVTSGGCTYSVSSGSPGTNIFNLVRNTVLPLPGSGTVSATTEYTWDTSNDGNVTQVSEWNFGTSLSGNPDRITNISYLNGSSYISANILNRPSSVTVTNGGGGTVAQTLSCYDYAGGCGGSSFASITGMPNHDDTDYGTGNTVRGDVTQVKQLVSGSTYVNTNTAYDMDGSVRSVTDANGNQTSLTYSSSYYDAYPTTVTNALSQSTSLGYDFNTGLLASITDPNSQTTSLAYDDMDRPTTTTYPDGGQTNVGYNYSGSVLAGSTVTKKITSSQNLVSTMNLDSMGRPASSVLSSDPNGADTVGYTYDSNGRAYSTTNPYRSTSDPTYGVETISAYDGLDRPLTVTRADGSVAHTYYGPPVSSNGGRSSQICSGYGVGYPILSVDEAGKKRQTWTDAFGRLIEADEPDSSNSLTVGTCYAYDLNKNLTQVVQNGSRTRTFSYDLSLDSRVLPIPNPERSITIIRPPAVLSVLVIHRNSAARLTPEASPPLRSMTL